MTFKLENMIGLKLDVESGDYHVSQGITEKFLSHFFVNYLM
jgi:ribosomal protein S19